MRHLLELSSHPQDAGLTTPRSCFQRSLDRMSASDPKRPVRGSARRAGELDEALDEGLQLLAGRFIGQLAIRIDQLVRA